MAEACARTIAERDLLLLPTRKATAPTSAVKKASLHNFVYSHLYKYLSFPTATPKRREIIKKKSFLQQPSTLSSGIYPLSALPTTLGPGHASPPPQYRAPVPVTSSCFPPRIPPHAVGVVADTVHAWPHRSGGCTAFSSQVFPPRLFPIPPFPPTL